MRLLYVEDNPFDADLLRLGLARSMPELSLDLADTIAEGMTLLENGESYDVILADLNLPDGNGLDLLHWVRERNLPPAFVILTGSGDQRAVVAALKAGADDYLVKREQYLEQLPDTLTAAVERARLERAWKSRPLQVLYAEHHRFDIDLSLRQLALAAPHLRVEIVDDATGVLERLSQADAGYDVLLLDYQLPGMDALDLTKTLRREYRLDLPIVVVTGQGSEEVAAQSLRLGVTDYLVKHSGYLHELPVVIDNAYRRVSLARERAALLATTTRLQEVLATSPAVNYSLCHRDGEWQVDWISDNLGRITGFTATEALTPGWWRTQLYPDDRARVLDQWARLGEVEHQVLEYRLCCRDGSAIWVRDEWRLTDDNGRRRVVGVWNDITEQRATADLLRLDAAVIDSTHDGVLITDTTGRIVSVNRAFTEITGYRAPEALGHNPSLLQSGRHGRAFFRTLWNTLLETGHWEGEIWNRHRNSELYPAWLTINAVHDQAGAITHYVGVLADLSKLKQTEAHLKQLAHYDPLTDLPNRLLVQSRLEHAIELAQRRRQQVAVMFLDLDRFKLINDSLGHLVGDELLIAVAGRLKSRLRQQDTLGRLGGDEFMILIEQLKSPDHIAAIAKDLLETLSTPFTLSGGQEVFIHASIGISLYPDDGQDQITLMRNADAAMYRAKSAGRNTYGFYTEELTRHVSHRLELETRLRQALLQDEFLLHYQPVLSVTDDRLLGAEALIRWQPPSEAMVSPADFIPIAEDTGLILPIGEWVLRTACRQAKTWLDAGHDLGIAVNLSAMQLRRQDIAASLHRILQETGLPAERLELELTESSLMDHGEHPLELLARLKQLGVRLAVDDFGTGYSSLAYLKRFSIDRLKIDRSFIKDLADDPNDLAITTAIVAMARALAIPVQAEGVETPAQIALLRRLNCDSYQGYLCSPPLSVEAFEERFLGRG